MSGLEVLIYEQNPKHKLPWQPGRKGTLCPSWTHGQALQLLQESVPAPNGTCRYATASGMAFCGRQHRPGVWHGYPIGWEAVPPKIRRQWMKEGKVSKKQVKDSWEEAKRSADE
jgi:hypothetical protein